MTINIEKIKAAALAVTGWKLNHAWLDTSEDESVAVVGHIDEDGNEYAVITVDCDQYFAGRDSLPLAKFYAKANPSAVLQLIERLEAAEQDAERYRFLKTTGDCITIDYRKNKYRAIDIRSDSIIYKWHESYDEAVDEAMEAMKEKP